MRISLLALLIVLVLPATAAAAVDRPGVAEIRQHGTAITWVFGLPADELASLAGGDTKEQLAGYMANNVRIAMDTVSCSGGMTHATPERFGGRPFTRVHMRYDCPREAGRFTVTNELLLTIRTRYDLGGTSGTFRFDADHIVLEARSPEFPRWVADGFEALAFGWEHVLFLVVLLLGARTARECVTFAGSVTAAFLLALVLATYGVVNVPERTLEALTVASIVAVAALPVLGIAGRAQLSIVFALALVHGLAFAIVVPDERALGGFALGLLLAEALIVTVAGALLLAFPKLVTAENAMSGQLRRR